MRKLLVGLAVPVVVIITAVIIIPFVLPVEAYKDRLIALVKQAMGRELQIAGPVRLSLLPALTIKAKDVSFGNAPGALTPQMVRAKELRFELQLLPLFHRVLMVDRMVLVVPVISLELDNAGHPNWVLSQAAPSSPVPAGGKAGPATTAGGWGISSLELGEVRIIDGKIDYSDQRTGEAEQLNNVDTTLTLRNGGPLVAQGSAVWHGERVTLALDLGQPRLLLDGSESQVDIKLAAHPESFQLDPMSGRVFVNVPDAGHIAVVDLAAAKQVASWPVPDRRANFPLAIDGSGTTVATVFRHPARLVLLDTRTGAVTQQLETCGDADDVFFDTKRRRIYVSCGAGAVDVFQSEASGYRPSARVETSSGARTSLFVPELDRLYVAARAGLLGSDAAILVFRPLP